MTAINYERRGSGDPLVLLHGIAHRWQAWEPVLDDLARHHDVIALDLPGFGRSPRPAGGEPPTVPALAARIATFLADLGVDRPHVAGNSLGGALALELAATGVARTATALSPAGFATRPEAYYALGVLIEHRALTYLPTGIIRKFVTSPRGRTVCMGMIMSRPQNLSIERVVGDALAMRQGTGFRRQARALSAYRFIGSPTVPVTVAWGDRDKILLLRQASRARAHLPAARHVTLTGCGHVPMSDDPDLVAATILETTGAVVRPD